MDEQGMVAEQFETEKPGREGVMADSMGFALPVVVERVISAEQVVLMPHDLFGLLFEEIVHPRRRRYG